MLQLHSTLSVHSNTHFLRLYNAGNTDIQNFKLCFTILLTEVSNIQNAICLYSLGSYIEFSSLTNKLPVNTSWEFSYKVVTEIGNNISHAPSNPFVVCNTEEQSHIIPVEEMPVHFIDIPQELQKKIDALSQENKAHLTTVQSLPIPPISIIPYPSHTEVTSNTAHNTIDISQGMKLKSTNIPHTLQIGLQNAENLFKKLTLDMQYPFLSSQATTMLYLHPFEKHTKSTETYAIHFKKDEDTEEVHIYANTSEAVQYACTSILQLLSAHGTHIPLCYIEDTPRFNWRGCMLDTVRQFYSVKEIKRFLDIIALHKINTFHWHLTDDEAWRIQLDCYPTLCDWAFRGYGKAIPPLFGSGHTHYGGYYSKNDITEIIHHAQKRSITIVPEIDLPGHSYTLIQALPQLLEKEDTSIYKSIQGYFPNTLNPALASTYKVVENIITEVSPLFPSKYFHIGGDEVSQQAWLQSPACKTLMHTQNLQTTKQLQYYFMKKIQAMVEIQGKHCCVWEEAGTLSQETILFSWTGPEAGLKAAKNGYPVVMCPSPYYYLDLAQSPDPTDKGLLWAGHCALKDCYEYEVAQQLSPNENTIQGIQANVWSETLHHKENLDYMILPRLAAISESAWTPLRKKDFFRFSKILQNSHASLLQSAGIGYNTHVVYP